MYSILLGFLGQYKEELTFFKDYTFNYLGHLDDTYHLLFLDMT